MGEKEKFKRNPTSSKFKKHFKQSSCLFTLFIKERSMYDSFCKDKVYRKQRSITSKWKLNVIVERFSLKFLGEMLVKDQESVGTSLVVQWLRFHTPSAGGPGLIPSQRTRSHVPQLRRVQMSQLKTLHV